MFLWLTGWRFFWTMGVALALGGASLVRFGVPQFPKPWQPWVSIVGMTMAIFGLGLIPFGTKKRMDEKSSGVALPTVSKNKESTH